MAHDTTILSGDIGVWWLDNNRAKMLHWIGGTEDNYTMNELYSAMMTLQDESTTIDDGTCFYADTPTEYTIGKIDSGDAEPWYISYELMEHITGGALRTSGWARTGGGTGNCGIVMVAVTAASSAIVPGDRGYDITNGTTSDAGTLLEVLSDGGTYDYLLIRPDSNGTANDFDGTTGTLTCNGHSATVIYAGATTGDQIWANIYSIGTIESAVHLYIYQGAALTTDARDRVFSWQDNTVDWYGSGHIDTTVALKDMTQSTWTVIDGGYLNVYARKGGDLYANFEVSNSTTSGGRNPVPLQTAVDLDQGTGTSVISFTGAVSGTFQDGEIIRQTTGTNAGAQGILDLTNSTVTSGGELVYFPISENDVGGKLLAFESGETIAGVISTASVTTDGAPAVNGPADSTWFTNSGTPPTVAFGNTTADIDNDTNNEFYGITIDCNQNPLTEVYEWIKYICQYGITSGDIATAETGIDGQEYIGATAYFSYSTISGTIAEGESVTQATSGATGVIISHDTSNKIVLLRSTRGTFASTLQVDADDDSDYFDATGLVAGNFAPKSASPLGTFAGGTFFGARGVLLSDYLAADENSFILTDIGGTTRERPTSIVIEVTNLEGTDETTDTDDLLAVFVLTGSGGSIEKTTMTCDGSEVAGDTTLDVDAIPTWAPSAGRIVLVDVSDNNKEYVIRYSSYNSSTNQYTLANIDVASADTATTTVITESGAFGSALRGDLVYNHDRTAVSYVKSVDSANQITISPAITGQTTGDHIELNCIPIALVDSADKVYNAIMHKYAANTEEQASIIYPGSTVYFRVRVRNTRSSSPIRPYSSDGSTSGTDQSVPTVRNDDTIIS